MLLLIFLLFSLGQLGRISFNNQQINFYLYEIFIFLQILYLFYQYRFKPVIKYFNKINFLPILLLWLLFSYLITFLNYSISNNIVAILYWIRLGMYILWGIYLFYSFEVNKNNRKNLFKYITLLIGLILTVSLIQYFLYPDLNNLRYLGWDMHYNRLFGVFFDTSITGAILGYLFWVIIFLKKYFKNIYIWAFLLLLCLICSILTFSRNFYIAFVLSIICYLIIYKNWKIVLITLLSFILILFLVPKQFGPGVGLLRAFTFQSRVEEYANAIKIWQKSPLIGIGYNRIRYLKEKYGQLNVKLNTDSHSASSYSSSFAIILVTGGIIGFLIFLISLFKVASMSDFSLVIIIFVSLMSLADNIILHPFILFLLSWSIGYFIPSHKQS